jgi:outer membrane usher protein FimD/PapC
MLALSFVAGCASVPTGTPRSVDLHAGAKALSRDNLSFNAQVLSNASQVESSFAANLESAPEPVTRLESAYTQQLGEDRLRIGDSVSSVGMWGSAVRFAGMQFGSRTIDRADVIAAAPLANSGLAVLPTVADALFASVGGPAVAFTNNNLSSTRGKWDPLKLTVKDVFGRSTAVDGPIIPRTRLAASGCDAFSVGIGRARRDFAIRSNEYGPLFANTTVSCGGPLGFTIESHGEYLQDEVAALGIGFARPVGPLGTVSVAFASSRAEQGSGWLARAGFEHRNSLFNIMLRSRLQSRAFREVGSLLLSDPIMERGLASIGMNVGEAANLSLAYATQLTWARERSNLLALKQSVSLGRGSLSMSAGHSFADDLDSSLFIHYNRPLGSVRVPRDVLQEVEVEAMLLPASP